MTGIFFITVPIGNPEDITVAARKSLEDIDFIYAEDTRVVKDLLSNLGIVFEKKVIRSFYDHSSEAKLHAIIEVAKDSKIAYVSDAGSPMISDPGFPLLSKAIEEGVNIEFNSGITSVNAAIERSALPCTPYSYHGFLSRDKGKIKDFIDLVEQRGGMHVFFEGVSRVESTMDIFHSYGHQSIKFAICRELTKTYESVYRFDLSQWPEVKDEIVFKGEFVLIAYSELKSTEASKKLTKLAQDVVDSGAHPKKLSKLLSSLLDCNTKDIYSKLNK